ncbi:MAG: hypothetical protein CSA07_04180 [Bacteroidia bacterium]|nr:MAG: hypothetical protein CSA07_04180 [Bacteroidia bacterium]
MKISVFNGYFERIDSMQINAKRVYNSLDSGQTLSLESEWQRTIKLDFYTQSKLRLHAKIDAECGMEHLHVRVDDKGKILVE